MTICYIRLHALSRISLCNRFVEDGWLREKRCYSDVSLPARHKHVIIKDDSITLNGINTLSNSHNSKAFQCTLGQSVLFCLIDHTFVAVTLATLRNPSWLKFNERMVIPHYALLLFLQLNATIPHRLVHNQKKAFYKRYLFIKAHHISRNDLTSRLLFRLRELSSQDMVSF